jgi:uncharacterized spore protein YtfJ
MSVDKLFEAIEQARNAASWQNAFGEPQVMEGRTLVPVSQAGYGFGLGFGQGPVSTEGEDSEPTTGGEGGGGGGGASVKPLGVIVVTPEDVYFEETMDVGKVSLAGMALVTLAIFQIAKTLRVIFGQS